MLDILTKMRKNIMTKYYLLIAALVLGAPSLVSDASAEAAQIEAVQEAPEKAMDFAEDANETEAASGDEAEVETQADAETSEECDHAEGEEHDEDCASEKSEDESETSEGDHSDADHSQE